GETVPMSDQAERMVERVARAIARAHGKRRANTDSAYFHANYPTVDKYVDQMWPVHADDARTAIEAMREPTEGMLNPGNPPYRFYPTEMRELWIAMIDAALAEK